MKTAHLVVGIVLIILAVILGAAAISYLGSTCAATPEMGWLLELPTCRQVATSTVTMGGAGLLFLLIGIVVLATGGEKRTPQPIQPQPGYVSCPHCTGQNYPTAAHCQWCGKPMKTET